jgi:hypothetical protein
MLLLALYTLQVQVLRGALFVLTFLPYCTQVFTSKPPSLRGHTAEL